jgi:hypothetical protein
MSMVNTSYRLARLYFKSGVYKDLILSQTEIINLSTAIALVDDLEQRNQVAFTLWYDDDLGDEHKRLSFILRLQEVTALEIGDREFTLEELKDFDYKKFKNWDENSFLTKKDTKSKKKIKPKKGRRKKK